MKIPDKAIMDILLGWLIILLALETLLLHCGPEKIWDCITWKGLKLNTRDLLGLLQHANARTQFWMFHGREPAVEDPDAIKKFFRLFGRVKYPGGKDWMLSIYSRKGPVL